MQKKFKWFSYFACLSYGLVLSAQAASVTDQLKAPAGFKVEYFAEKIEDARSMTLGSDGVVYVGTREHGSVYALVDANNDGKAEQTVEILKGLNGPNGVSFYKGDLYIAENHRIIKLAGIKRENLTQTWKPTIVFKDLPRRSHHGWRYINFGPDGWLYIAIGAPCNVCLEDDKVFATISRIDLKNEKLEVYAAGIRNSVGFDWHPGTKDLWFTENGRDWLGDESPPDEINRADKAGLHFGFPFMHGTDIKDPGFWDKKPANLLLTAPSFNNTAHVANLGMRFYRGKMFPEQYREHIFFVEHGSWNRKKKAGYQIRWLKLKGNNAEVESVSTFIDGWLKANGDVIGRPVDLLELADGSVLVSDDFNHAVYRISYSAK